MGLFDKKKSAEQSPTPAEPEGVPRPATVATSGPVATAPVTQVPEPSYGIRQAIELMRGLPGDNVDLVVHVVKKTLESMGIQIETIVQDAALKQGEIEARVGVMREEIAELDQEIQLRRDEIGRMEADCREIILVKERLLLAQRLGQNPPPARPPASQREQPREARPEPHREARTEPQAVVVASRSDARTSRRDTTPVDLPVMTIEAQPPPPRPEPAPVRPPPRVVQAPHTTGSHQAVSPPTRPLPGATLTPKK
jgi:hypothetical protein